MLFSYVTKGEMTLPFNSTSSKPVIGILIGRGALARLQKQMTKHVSYFRYIETHYASKIAGVHYYYFSLDSIQQYKIQGTYYNETTGIWEKAWFYYPDVLYNRLVSPKQNHEQVNRMLSSFDRLNIPKINARHFFNKWDFHQKLMSNASIKKHLPHTKYTHKVTPTILASFFQHFQSIYIKGSEGRMGNQVMKITKLRHGDYHCTTHGSRITHLKVKSLHALTEAVNLFHDKRSVIVQQTIPLMTLNGKIVDFRAELQRDGRGQLKVLAIIARVGKQQSPITTHASSIPFAKLFKMKHTPPVKIGQYKQQAVHFVTQVYRAVEKAYGPFGELGIDFALDGSGKLWLIECNARTAKVSLYKASSTAKAKAAFLNPLMYAKFLLSKQ